MLVKTQSQQQATWHCDLHAQITHAIIVIDSMNPLQKVKSGMGCPNWHTAMHSLWLQRLMWIYCPGHAGVSGNERAYTDIDWQAQQISHLVYSLAGQRCCETWETFWIWTGQSITALTAWRQEELRKEAADIPPSEVRNDLCSTRQTLALFQGQPCGDSWETEWSAYGPLWALRYCLESHLVHS